MAYERQSWWTEKPVVHIVRRVVPDQSMPVDPGFAPILASQSLFADWTPANQEPHEETIEAYSNCDEVELLLNSKSLGAQKRNPDDSARVWRVAWAPGEIRAIGRNGGTIAAEHVLRTATKPAKIILSADRDRLTPNWDSVAYVSATITDENGTRIPNSSDLISFEISGPGFIAAVDSADDASHETFHAKNRRAYQGRCYAIVKRNASKGKIIVKASAPGLKSASVSLYGEGLWIERH
jgi:beta-galactosidase